MEEEIIPSATRFYQCSKALDQGKFNQSESTQDYNLEDISLLQVQIANPEKNLSDALNKQNYWTLILQHKHNKG